MKRVIGTIVCLFVVLALGACAPEARPDLSGSAGATVSSPSLKGLSAEEASAALAAAGLLPSVTESYSSTAPAGTIISQNPAPGTDAAKGSKVEVIVSKGPKPPGVPNVVNMMLGEATSTLTSGGYTVVIARKATEATAGTVISQKPAPGTKQEGGTVTITISTGLPPIATRLLGKWTAKDGSTYEFRPHNRVVVPSGGQVRYRLTNGVLLIMHPVDPLTADIEWVSADRFKLTPRTATGHGPTVTYSRVK